jgi:hypothetical protein
MARHEFPDPGDAAERPDGSAGVAGGTPSGSAGPGVEGVREPDRLTVELPLPPYGCSPNAHAHHFKRHRAVNSYRKACSVAFASARNKAGWKMAEQVVVHVSYRAARVYCKRDFTYHPKDEDNARAALKGAFDAMVDTNIVSSDAHGKVRWGRFTMVTALRDLQRLGLTHGVTLTIERGWPAN